MTISGDVVRYEAGRVIVIRDKDGNEVAFTLSRVFFTVPDVQAGQRVTLYTERSADGSRTTYAITSESSVPEHLVTGKNITLVVPNPRERVVRTITVSEP